MTEIARNRQRTHVGTTARPAPAPSVDRHFGAVFVTPLKTPEYLLLSVPGVRRWPLGGRMFLDRRDTVVGYHWHKLYPALGTDWSSHTTAFAAFIPDAEQRERLGVGGWKVRPDGDTALLGPHFCSATPPWAVAP